ncbi:MAG: DUF547 domain-containing protein [Gammaproteobacteria bacterium]|nr:MAG: DUF547 domain-containing protein [Gammaproteobacteria bacterium]
MRNKIGTHHTMHTLKNWRCAWLLAFALCATAGLAPAAHGGLPDYSGWDQLLLQNVRDGYVDYDGIRADPQFDAFIAALARAPGEFGSPAEELAYYINAYNAFAIRGILDGYSPDTRFGRFRFFKTRTYRLAGENITLDELEHQRIRPMGDARSHFAISCASISCPRLLNRAYLPETLDAQLDDAARRFVNDITRNDFDIAQRTAFVSPIFDWFHEDFEHAAGTLPEFLARYTEEPAARAALLEGRLAIRHLPYDWDLNGHYSGE